MFYLMNQVGHLDGTFPMQATVFPCCVPDFASALPYLLMLGIGICVAAVLVGAAVGWLTWVLHPKGTARSGALIGTLTGAVSVGLAVTMLLITMHGKWFPHLLGILVAGSVTPVLWVWLYSSIRGRRNNSRQEER